MNSIFKPSEWFSNVQSDMLAGVVVALALIPEAIAFSIIADVDPKIGLYTSFCMAITIAFVGGRPAMISAATGAMALLMITLVKEHGLQYLIATTLLTGLLQIVWGWVRLGNRMRFIPRAVMIGFVNALAIVIFQAQLPQLNGDPLLVYGIVAVGLAIIYGFPRLTTLIPAPLVAIVAITAASMVFGWTVPTVGDMGDLPTSLPTLGLPSVPLTLETLEIILPYALALSLVGLVESFLTANVLDELTDTASNKNQEAIGQGIANIVAGLFGGMAGCAMIGQSVINVRSGGRTRLSTLSAGVFLLLCIILLNPWVAQIPVAALVAVMFMVSFSTFNWNSIRYILKVPKSETAVMLTTVGVTLYTHNLALGVLVGILLSTLFFSRKIAKLITVTSHLDTEAAHRTYIVTGQIFFVAVEEFLNSFDFREKLAKVTVDLTHAHLWDQSAVDGVDKVVFRFKKHDVAVELIGLNEASETLLERLAVHRQADGEMAMH